MVFFGKKFFQAVPGISNFVGLFFSRARARVCVCGWWTLDRHIWCRRLLWKLTRGGFLGERGKEKKAV